jgi:hypothetical protein
MTAPERSCGDCTLCCKTMGVAEIAKPRDHWCPHIVHGQGCAIYETRPGACRGFFCIWIHDTSLGPEWKPSKCKMVLTQDSKSRMTVQVDSGAPGVWRREPHFSQLMRMAKNRLIDDAILMVVDRGRTYVLLPDDVVELGVVGQQDQIVLAKSPVPGGFAYDVSVRRAE